MPAQPLTPSSLRFQRPVTNCRALALTVEELRALLALVLGGSNIALLFLTRALAVEQQGHDKAKLNLEVMQKQVRHTRVDKAVCRVNVC